MLYGPKKLISHAGSDGDSLALELFGNHARVFSRHRQPNGTASIRVAPRKDIAHENQSA